MQTDDYKLIELYLRAELDEAGQQAFEARLASDEAFAEEFRFQKEIQSFMGHREQRQALQTQLQALQKKEDKGAKVIPLSRRIFYLAGAAAAVAIILFFALPMLMPGSLYQQFADHQSLALQERGDNEALVSEAENAFNAHDYERAYAKLTELLKADPEDVRAQLALGIAALETDRVGEAKTIFETLRGGESAMKDNASWYLALTYVKAGDHEQARILLQSIPEGTFWSGKAKALLEKL